jgi:hypothetical protein
LYCLVHKTTLSCFSLMHTHSLNSILIFLLFFTCM